ncbi:uncharacterized protein METZ01_LOCUS487379, partial [marine metagenome]
MQSEPEGLCLEDQAESLDVPSGIYMLSEQMGGEQYVEGLELDRHPVTVERFSAFIDEGGYHSAELWDDAGWIWSRAERLESPRFWDDPDPKWSEFLTPDRPVIGVS